MVRVAAIRSLTALRQCSLKRRLFPTAGLEAATTRANVRQQQQRCFHLYPTISVPPQVRIVEVGPRDGLQNEPAVSTADKIRLVQMLADAGCSYIEAGSFVSPQAVPSMADSFQVMEALHQTQWGDASKPPVLACLVPNRKGLEQAIRVGADEIAIFGSASEAFSQKNINCSIAESMDRFRQVTQLAAEHGIPVRGYLSCVVACPYQGPILPSQVAKVAETMLHQLGCHELSLGDTIGVGTPASTVAMLEAVEPLVENQHADKRLAVHFHDTYGQALANILVSLERGISVVDSSVAGLGGCPYAKGATGNVATEDVVYMLDGLGVQTGIHLDKLVDAAEFISGVLGRPSKSRAGSAIAAKRTREG